MPVGIRGLLLGAVALTASSSMAFAAENALAEATVSNTLPFYLRIDGGYAFQDISGLRQDELLAQGGSFVANDLENSGVIGVGIGVRLSPSLRLDLTGEHRTSTQLRAQDHLTTELSDPDGLLDASTRYDADYAAWVGLANLYVDLPKVDQVTQYVGAGIGFARNSLSEMSAHTHARFIDDATGAAQIQEIEGRAGASSETSFAWAVMAGLSFDAGEFGALDLGYRYIDLGGRGSVTSGRIECPCGTNGSPLVGDDVSAHEIRIGIRWELGQP